MTNSVRFDPQSISASLDNPQSFGEATALLTNYRLAQFAARMEFELSVGFQLSGRLGLIWG